MNQINSFWKLWRGFLVVGSTSIENLGVSFISSFGRLRAQQRSAISHLVAVNFSRDDLKWILFGRSSLKKLAEEPFTICYCCLFPPKIGNQRWGSELFPSSFSVNEHRCVVLVRGILNSYQPLRRDDENVHKPDNSDNELLIWIIISELANLKMWKLAICKIILENWRIEESSFKSWRWIWGRKNWKIILHLFTFSKVYLDFKLNLSKLWFLKTTTSIF